MKTPTGRWADDPQPVVVATPATYSAQAQGPVRRAELHDAETDSLLGHVWTDDQAAAGFLDEESAGAAGVRAGADVWGILRDAHQAGRPAAEVLDPALYAPAYRLDV
jgi:hypothetical protein